MWLQWECLQLHCFLELVDEDRRRNTTEEIQFGTPQVGPESDVYPLMVGIIN